MEEMVDIVTVFYSLEGAPREVAQERLGKYWKKVAKLYFRAKQIFEVLDVNGDGDLDEDEFCK